MGDRMYYLLTVLVLRSIGARVAIFINYFRHEGVCVRLRLYS